MVPLSSDAASAVDAPGAPGAPGASGASGAIGSRRRAAVMGLPKRNSPVCWILVNSQRRIVLRQVRPTTSPWAPRVLELGGIHGMRRVGIQLPRYVE